MELNVAQKTNPPVVKIDKRKNQQFRVVLNKDANEALEEITNLINKDFEHGEINKSDIANWVLAKVKSKISTQEIEQIKEDNFDESKVLANLLKNAKSDKNSLPEDVLLALKNHVGLAKGRSKKPSKKD
ncbi:MAG: hypothetical protein H6623_01600 [Bdellovibrionaceae bacterium]|nr:hypothetical protein [Pseudobdellovibrionaceae bacterium]